MLDTVVSVLSSVVRLIRGPTVLGCPGHSKTDAVEQQILRSRSRPPLPPALSFGYLDNGFRWYQVMATDVATCTINVGLRLRRQGGG